MILLIFLLGCQLAFARLTIEDSLYHKPEQIHISYGDKLNDIVVMWSTFNDTSESRVKYGRSVLNEHASGRSVRFPYQSRVQYIHTVMLRDLEYNTKYVYYCGSEQAWSDMFSFKTPRARESDGFEALIIGDMGATNARALPHLKKELARKDKDYKFILHVGDIAYDLVDQEAKIGDRFLNQVQPLAAAVPYMTSPGNHEMHYNFSHYKIRFRMPQHKHYESMYYSWNIGPVHWVAANTEAYYYTEEYGMDPLLNSFRWLMKDLEEANKPENRKLRPWVIVYGHRPMYCSNSDDPDCAKELTLFGDKRCGQELNNCLMEPLLQQHGVDVALWAHEHSFERTWPLYAGKVYNGSQEHPYVNPKAPIHVIQGSAGSHGLIDDFVKNPAAWSAFRYADYGYTRFSAFNATHLYFEQISATTGEKVIDSYWVVKDRHGTYNI